MPSDVYFTTNPSEFGKLPGLYVSERNPPGFIRGADLSVVGFAGKCVRGPSTPMKITTTGRFLEVYGGRARPGAPATLLGEVWKALLNKQFGTIYVRRVVPADAALATKNLSNVVPTAIVRVDATSKGAWGNDVQVAVEDATDADATHFNLVVTYNGQTYTYANLNMQTGQDNSLDVIGDDEANVIVVTKLASGRPLNSVAASLTSGADGTAVAADYQTPINDLAVEPGVGIVLVPEKAPTPATVNGYLVTAAPTVADRLFLTWSSDETNTDTDDTTDIAAQITTRSDRIVWCYNAPYTVDPETGTETLTGPHVWMASVLSQLDVDVHPGAADARPLLAGIKRLYNPNLSRAQLKGLQAAGISAIERLPGEFRFRMAVTTDLTPGRTEITRRRETDFLQLSAADRLRFYVKAINTPANRGAMIGELVAFSSELRSKGRIVQDFAIDSESVNTEAQRAEDIEQILWRVKLIGHMNSIVLQTEIGTDVTISEAAA
jgi:hypothetical protein